MTLRRRFGLPETMHGGPFHGKHQIPSTACLVHHRSATAGEGDATARRDPSPRPLRRPVGMRRFRRYRPVRPGKAEFLRRPAPFENGIPSHDTLSAVFRALDPRESGVAFSKWAAGLAGRVEGAIIAIDGRTSRGSSTGGETPVHMIPAWCGDRAPRSTAGLQAREERDQRHPRPAGAAVDRGVDGDAGRDGVPARDRLQDPREGRRLRAHPQGQSGNPPGGCETVVRGAGARRCSIPSDR